MFKKMIYLTSLALVLVFCLTSSVHAANIIWVTETRDDDVDGVQDDQAFVDWLAAERHTLDVRIGYWVNLDPAKADELNAADLVIVSRSSNSGSYDDGDEPTLWNSVTTPLILMNGYIVRSSRWRWMDTTTMVKGDDILLALDPAHPVFAGVTLDAGSMVAFRDNTVAPGITSFVGSIDVGNGTLIARTLSADRAWIAEWAAGVEFYAGSGQTAGGPRMLFVAGTQEEGPTPQGAWDLTAEGEKMLLNAIRYMLGETVEPGQASDPKPANEETDVPREVVLSWTPGEYAPPVNGHKVYISENFNDVNDGVDGITQDANSYIPAQRLDLGTTYYWRVDEVNGTPDYTVYEGELWSFTTEPVAYPIENIKATASSSEAAKGPENTINGLGLDDSGLLHARDADDNAWLSSMTGSQPTWIEYEFDNIYKLHEMWVWNSNGSYEPVLGLGLKEVSIEYSVNGTEYTTLGTTHEFTQAPGASDYAHNTAVDLSGLAAKYVRLTANSNWGGLVNQYGLSEVRFFYIPVHAREPRPASGARDVDVDVTIGFRGGREAAQHDMYLSSDEQAVIDGTARVTTISETSYGPLSLDLGKTYYWKINEVNTAETPTMWETDVWNFATHRFLVVDDFELYNDIEPSDPESKRIFNVWIDGYQQPTNGSIVGYDFPPFAEQTIIHGGRQSIPFFYNNTGAAYAEAERTFVAAQNWTKAGIQTLTLYFRGTNGNTGQMYAKINGLKVVYDGDAGDITKPRWQQWNIDLVSLGAGLQNVTKLAVGIDGNGASGTLYFDDIRLYPLREPTEVNKANIIWVAATRDDDADGVQDDQGFIDWLVAEGHTVDVRLDYWGELDAAKADELNAADLVIISRSTNSGDHDDGDEPTLWNSVTTPLILMNGYIVRSSRWRWMDTTTMVKGDDIMLAIDPTHPVFAGVTLEAGNMVIFRDNTVAPGITSFVGSIDAGNGTLIAQASGAENAWIAEWPAGVEFYAGSGQTAGGPRMLFVAGTQEEGPTPQGAWDLTTEGELVLRNAINYMLP
jgi:hypothetical protein